MGLWAGFGCVMNFDASMRGTVTFSKGGLFGLGTCQSPSLHPFSSRLVFLDTQNKQNDREVVPNSKTSKTPKLNHDRYMSKITVSAALAKSYCVIDFPEELDMAPYTKPTPAPKPLGSQSEHGPRSGSAILIGDPDALAQRLRTSLRLGARIEPPRGSVIVSASAENGQPPKSHAGPANDMHRGAFGHRLANGSAGEHDSDAEEVLGGESGDVAALLVDSPMKSARTVEHECRQAPLLDDATTSGISKGNLQSMMENRQVSKHDQQSTHEIAPDSQSQSAHTAAVPMTAAATHEPQPGSQSQAPEPQRARIIARTWASYTDDARRDSARAEGSAYTLWAVVVHHGSAMGGHFTAYRYVRSAMGALGFFFDLRCLASCG
jgi:hypothetical protein